jgi:amino acid transporter
MAQTDIASMPRPWLWWGLAAVTIVLGYADLARGGMTVAPILLVVGYCVLVPLAILRS